MPAETPQQPIEDRDLADAAAAVIRLDAEISHDSAEAHKGLVEVDLPSLDNAEARAAAVSELLVPGAIVRKENTRVKAEIIDNSDPEISDSDKVFEALSEDGETVINYRLVKDGVAHRDYVVIDRQVVEGVDTVLVEFEPAAGGKKAKKARMEVSRAVAVFMGPVKPKDEERAKGLDELRERYTMDTKTSLLVPPKEKSVFEAKQTA